METRALVVALIAILFWIAPSPNSSQAHEAVRSAGVSARSTVSAPTISIKPYVKPIQEK